MIAKNWLSSSLLLLALAFASACAGKQQASQLSHEGTSRASYDFVISGARIVDGTGAPWVLGDIGIKGDRIAAIGDLHEATATKRIDAAGIVAAPGFIDVQGQSEFNLLVDNRAASKITQ